MKPTVVFLHGLARTHRSLSSLRRHVERRGYPTWSQTYPSRRLSVGELAKNLAESIRRDVGDGYRMVEFALAPVREPDDGHDSTVLAANTKRALSVACPPAAETRDRPTLEKW